MESSRRRGESHAGAADDDGARTGTGRARAATVTPPAGGGSSEFGLSRRPREVAGRMVTFDNEGFLWTSDDWDDDVAVALAAEAGLTVLDETHWRVLRYLRTFYRENGRAPLNRQLAAGIDMPLLKLETLFPGGIKQGARRLAGLPNPKTCM